MHAMITYGKVEVQLYSFLTMALSVCVQSTSHPGWYAPTEYEGEWAPETVYMF
jgi:hypothetical protein